MHSRIAILHAVSLDSPEARLRPQDYDAHLSYLTARTADASRPQRLALGDCDLVLVDGGHFREADFAFVDGVFVVSQLQRTWYGVRRK